MITKGHERALNQYLVETTGVKSIALYELRSNKAERTRRSLFAHSTIFQLKFSYSTTRTLT